jgi:hypothetical protein
MPLVFLIAPSEDKNKPLSSADVCRLKKSSRLLLMGYVLLISILVFAVPNILYAFSLSMGVFAVGLSLLANFIRHRVGKNNAVSREGGNCL